MESALAGGGFGADAGGFDFYLRRDVAPDQMAGLPTPNAERQAALAARQHPDPGPLFVVYQPEEDRNIDMRTILFYSSRDVVEQQLPDDLSRLEAAVKARPVVDVIMIKATATTLGRRFVVRPVEESGDVELAQVSRKP